jgi:hypothetical protein
MRGQKVGRFLKMSGKHDEKKRVIYDAFAPREPKVPRIAV